MKQSREYTKQERAIIAELFGKQDARKLLNAAIDKILDAKQDLTDILSQFPQLQDVVDGHLAVAVDTLINASRKEQDNDTNSDYDYMNRA